MPSSSSDDSPPPASAASDSSQATTSEPAPAPDAATEAPATAPAISAAAAKTPVSLLQELYVRRGLTPKYDLLQIEGAVHEPTFKYRVTVGEFVATGSGQSKKKAKHCAAKAVLEKIKQSSRHSRDDAHSGTSTSADVPPLGADAAAVLNSVVPTTADLDALSSPFDDGIEGNPVGELQELCMNRRIQPPTYEVNLQEGQPHERKFIMKCSVGKHQEMGCGKSKKLAKRQAASKMLAQLQAQPHESDESAVYAILDEDDLAQGIAQQKSRDAHAQAGGKSRNTMSKFYKNLKPKAGPKLLSLRDMPAEELEKDPNRLLEDIAQEQDFGVTYVEIEERSTTGLCQSLVQLSTVPVAVCFGSGETEKEAERASAMHALEYLRVMTN